jgi:adenylate cyclase
MSQQRHLAAILFTDIVGYTALMQEDEHKAVALIKHYSSSLIEKVGTHGGQVLNYYGDGSLCTFPSATEAVTCALELQKELQTDPYVPLRIGLPSARNYMAQVNLWYDWDFNAANNEWTKIFQLNLVIVF